MGPLPPALDRWVTSYLMLLSEVEVGVRDARHLRGLMTAPLLRGLAQHTRRRGAPAQVVRVRGIRQRGRWQVVGLVRDGHGVRAIALELADDRARPLVTSLGSPELGPLAPDDIASEEEAAGWCTARHRPDRSATEPSPPTTAPVTTWTLPEGWRVPAA